MKILLVPLSLIIASLSCVYPGRHMMDWGYMHYGYGGVLMWIILLALIAVVVYFLFSGQRLIKRDDETPLEILKKRYAKGEITKDDFERIKKDIT